MGVYLSFSAYKKDSKGITGHVRPLGLYEANLDLIEADKVFSADAVTFYSGINCIDVLLNARTNLWDLEIMEEDLRFYKLATNYFSGNGLKTIDSESHGVMFDPLPILRVISTLIRHLDSIKSSYVAYEVLSYEEEKRLLPLLQSLLQKSVDSGAVVYCVWA